MRVLELIDNASDARIELEGNRLPVTHSKDVIHVLSSGGLAVSRAAPADVFPAIRRALLGCQYSLPGKTTRTCRSTYKDVLSTRSVRLRGACPGGPGRAGR